MRTVFLVLATAVALVGCLHPDEGQPTDWASIQLQGKTLDLVDDVNLESYSFTDQGLVAVTIGTKGGPVAAPLYYWKVKDKLLVISEAPDQAVVEELANPKLKGDLLSVNRQSGARVQFHLVKTNG